MNDFRRFIKERLVWLLSAIVTGVVAGAIWSICFKTTDDCVESYECIDTDIILQDTLLTTNEKDTIISDF